VIKLLNRNIFSVILSFVWYQNVSYIGVMSPTNKFVVDIAQAVESTFGIITQRFRIYHRIMCLLPKTVLSVVKATVVLHNMLQAVSEQTAVFDFGANDEEEHSNTLGDLGGATGPHGACEKDRTEAMAVRETFKDYFLRQHTDVAPANDLFSRDVLVHPLSLIFFFLSARLYELHVSAMLCHVFFTDSTAATTA